MSIMVNTTPETVFVQPLATTAFAPYGDVLDAAGAPDRLINQGLCGRWHDRAQLDFGPDGRAGISILQADVQQLPYQLDLLERHPEASQAFIPISGGTFLVVVADDQNGVPANIKAFQTAPGQAVNIRRNVWHGVLTPLTAPGLFAVIDRIGATPYLQEHWLTLSVTIQKQG